MHIRKNNNHPPAYFLILSHEVVLGFQNVSILELTLGYIIHDKQFFGEYVTNNTKRIGERR